MGGGGLILVRVELPFAVFGMLASARDRRVLKAAPIAGWARGRQLDDVRAYYARKHGDGLGWSERVDEPDAS